MSPFVIKPFSLLFSSHCSTQNIGFINSGSGYVIKLPHQAPLFKELRLLQGTFVCINRFFHLLTLHCTVVRFASYWHMLQLTASPWTIEVSTREGWHFGALTNRKATSSNRAPSLSSLYYNSVALSLYKDKRITIIRLWWLSQWLVAHGHHLAVTIYLHVAPSSGRHTREPFVALGLPSWTYLRTWYWGVFTLQGARRFA